MTAFIDPHDARDIAWREAARAVERRPHPEVRMQSANSLGQMKSWFCPICCRAGGRIYETTVSTLTAPICTGGFDPYAR